MNNKKHFVLCLMMNLILFFIMISYNNLLIQWLLLEFSTLVNIFYINFKSKNKLPSLLIYSISSIVSLFLILMIIFYSIMNFKFSMLINKILPLIFMLKMGLIPFHYWMIYSVNLLNWNQIFFILTFMKYYLMFFFLNMMNLNYMFMLMLLFNMIMIPIMLNKNYSIKNLFAYSSIFSSLFFIIMFKLNFNIFIILLLIYILLMYMIISFLNYFKINNLNYMNLNINKNKINMFIILMLIYSMLPPFMTFLMKWIVSYTFIDLDNLWFILILLISSMMMIWNYLLVLNNLIMKYKTKKKIFFKLQFNMYNYFFIILFLSYLIMSFLFNIII